MGQPHELDSYQLLDALSSGRLTTAGSPGGAPSREPARAPVPGGRRRQTYPEFFGFREKPFDLTPNPDYLYLPHRHKEALAALLMGLEEGMGFLKITAEPGTGKTTLCRSFLKNLKGHYRWACITQPAGDGIELLQSINQQYGLPAESTSKKELLLHLSRFLLNERRQDRRAVILIDEAQNLPAVVWEEIRLLSNLETETEKLIQFVLLGQPGLDRFLSQTEWRSIRQRIALAHHWTPFNREETRGYIHYRIHHAGGKGKVWIDDRAFECVYRFSQGVPRMINALMDRALTLAHNERIKKISAKLIRQAAADLGGLDEKPPFLQRSFKLLMNLVFLAVAAALGLFFAFHDKLGWKPSWGIDLDPVIEYNLFNTRPPGTLKHPQPVPPKFQPAVGLPVRLADGSYRIVHAGQLLGYFQSVPEEESALHARQWVFKTWRTPVAPKPGFNETDWLAVEAAHGLERLTLNANLERLTTLGYPALVTFQLGGDAGVRRLAYLGRVGNVGLFGSKDLLQIPLDVIDPVWDRTATILWKNFESLPETLQRHDRGEAVVWLQRQLKRFGFFDDLEAPLYGAGTANAVRQFQREQGLDATGRLDRETQLLLYNLLDAYPTPKLAGGRAPRTTG